MTEDRARQVANVVMAAAALGAAVLVFRSPRLRRMAWQAARQYAAGPLAAWTAGTVREAWDASARPAASGELPRPKDASARATAAPANVGRSSTG
jgi:hypothetical protein